MLCERLPALPVPVTARRAPQPYVAFVRAVMLGRRGLHRSTLLDLFGVAGATDVPSYITTGNVSFVARPSELARMTAAVEASIARVVDRPTEVFVRSVADLVALRELDVFAAAPLRGPHERVVSFLPGPPVAIELPMWSPARDLGVFAAAGRELFSVAVRQADGTSRGPGGLIEGVTGTRVTSRAWSTVERILTALS